MLKILLALGILFILFMTFVMYCCLVVSGRESDREEKRLNNDFQDIE